MRTSIPHTISHAAFVVLLPIIVVTSCAIKPQISSVPAKLGWPGEHMDQWHGGTRHIFSFHGHTAWVVEPKKPLPGNPWTWCTEFPDAFTDRTGVPELIQRGFYHVYINDFNGLGCPKQLALMEAFYADLRPRHLAPKVALIGLSRGGFTAYRFAEKHPQQVACIYGDAPVCDLKSWPGGKGRGVGSPSDWAHFKKLYGFKTDAEALAFKGNALDPGPLAALARAHIPLLNCVGDADTVVPPSENTDILAKRYRALGGELTIIHRPGAGHHPHGLDDPQPIVDFIMKYAGKK